MDVVRLNAMDDEILYRVATTLGDIGFKLRNGEEIDDLPSVLIGAGMAIAAVMAEAYERAIEDEKKFNLN